MKIFFKLFLIETALQTTVNFGIMNTQSEKVICQPWKAELFNIGERQHATEPCFLFVTSAHQRICGFCFTYKSNHSPQW